MARPAFELGTIVAERVLILEPRGTVTVQIGLPFTPDDYPDESWCPYQIEGLGSDEVRRTIGIDALQALTLALQTVGSTLVSSDHYKAGRLKAFASDEGRTDLGFPLYDGSEDLLPKA
jgi:hypothetical protein